jgi:predicted ATP-grasp superfamily ATP-dependent carboligase
MKKAYVMNCFYNGLSVIRELGRNGIKVLALDSIRNVGTFSRYAKYIRCPNPLTNENDFIEFIYSLASKEEEKPIIIPTNDSWATALSKHLDYMSKVAIPCVSQWKVMEKIINKKMFSDWCLENHYPSPNSWDIDDYENIPAKKYPLVLKPIARRYSTDESKMEKLQKVFDDNRLVVIDKSSNLKKFINSNAEIADKFFIQEYVRGYSDQMYTVGIYSDVKGNVKGIFTGRKVRGYPADIGDCMLGQSEALPEKIVTMVIEICKKIGFFGIGEFEFKKDTLSNEYVMIELNPRCWSWVGITSYCGVNLPLIAYEDLSNNSVANTLIRQDKEKEIKFVRLISDFLNCMIKYRLSGFKSWSLSFPHWRKSLKADRLVTAEFSKDDPFPGFVSALFEIKDFVLIIIKSLLMQKTNND